MIAMIQANLMSGNTLCTLKVEVLVKNSEECNHIMYSSNRDTLMVLTSPLASYKVNSIVRSDSVIQRLIS